MGEAEGGSATTYAIVSCEENKIRGNNENLRKYDEAIKKLEKLERWVKPKEIKYLSHKFQNPATNY